MKKTQLLLILLVFSANIFAQTVWNEVWNLQKSPFLAEDAGSEYAKVIAGFDTDQDGWGEFITGYTDLEKNHVFMYEATGDNTYEMVWYFEFPYSASSYFGAAVGDADNNGIVDIAIGSPVVVSAANPNPPRVFFFSWNGVQGENKYGREQIDGTFIPSSETHFDVPDNTDWRPYSMSIQDVDNDEMNEVLIGVRAGGRGREVMIASAVGDPSAFGSWQTEFSFQNSEGGSNYSTIAGDLDNDGLTDIIEIIWWRLTLRFFEATGPDTYAHVNDIEQVYESQAIDYGSVDGAQILDINGDGKNELVIAGADDAAIEKKLFLIQNVTDLSTISASDVAEVFTFPVITKPDGSEVVGGLRSLDAGDPDQDGLINLLIAGESNGVIYDLEYKGEGDLADSSSWSLTIAYNLYEKVAAASTDSIGSAITPRLYYGNLAGDMDKDGLEEYVFVNYSTDKATYSGDIYVSVIEADKATSIKSTNNLIPTSIKLSQNYPNPFNPSTTINFSIPQYSNVKLSVFDILGREVSILVNKEMIAGNYSIKFDANSFPSGIYFYKLVANDKSLTMKMNLLK